MQSTTSAESYLPNNLDEVLLQNGNGGYIGGTRDNGGRLMIVEKAQDWERFIYEASGDKFSLRQAVSNLYVGAV